MQPVRGFPADNPTEGAKATSVTITVSGVKYNFDLLASLEVNRDNKGGY